MNNTTAIDSTGQTRRATNGMARKLTRTFLGLLLCQLPLTFANAGTDMTTEHALSAKQQALIPIAAFTAIGDLPRLNTSLRQGLDAGLTVSESKETLVQMYAYAGFPRSLNALSELMKVLAERRQQGINDIAGEEPAPAPSGAALLDIGTANQTELSGAPVKGPLFEFAPAIDFYLKAHLFGDIFSRTNLDWRSRELATVSALSAMTGTEPQLLAHMRISKNVGLSTSQLRQAASILKDTVGSDAGRRANAALDQQ